MQCNALDMEMGMSMSMGMGWKGFPSGLNVLLVDHDPPSLLSIQAHLHRSHYNVTAFADISHAVDALANGENNFHVAIVEAVADMDGCKFQEATRQLPTIMTSNVENMATMMKYIALGAVEFLQKPLCGEKLRNIWQHVVRKVVSTDYDSLPESLKPIKTNIEGILETCSILRTCPLNALSEGLEYKREEKDCNECRSLSTSQMEKAGTKHFREAIPDEPVMADTKPWLTKSTEMEMECKERLLDCPSEKVFEEELYLCMDDRLDGLSDVKVEAEESSENTSRTLEILHDSTEMGCGSLDDQDNFSLEIGHFFYEDLDNGRISEDDDESPLNEAHKVEEEGKEVGRKDARVVDCVEKLNLDHGGKGGSKNSLHKKKMKVDWTSDLHRRFLQAVEVLGVDQAIPSKILEIMNVEGLTRHNIASHLQKYRSHRKHLLSRDADAVNRKLKPLNAVNMHRNKPMHIQPWPSIRPSPHPQYGHMAAPLHVWGHPTFGHSGSPIWPQPMSMNTWHPPDGLIWPFPLHYMTTPILREPQTADSFISEGGGTLGSCSSNFVASDPPKELLDSMIRDALDNPSEPLPLGLKSPSIESVMAELQKQGITNIPPLQSIR